jgi:hypothetical protein
MVLEQKVHYTATVVIKKVTKTYSEVGYRDANSTKVEVARDVRDVVSVSVNGEALQQLIELLQGHLMLHQKSVDK